MKIDDFIERKSKSKRKVIASQQSIDAVKKFYSYYNKNTNAAKDLCISTVSLWAKKNGYTKITRKEAEKMQEITEGRIRVSDFFNDEK